MSYPKKVMKKVGKFEVEDLLEWGREQIKNEDELDKDYINLHKFINELLDFEIGMDSGFKSMVGNKKTAYNLIKEGGKFTASMAFGMVSFAKGTIRELGYIRSHPLKIICKRKIKEYDKYSFEGFYYRSGLRYLQATGLR